ncbi:tRNA 2-selenouridine(34) synthase MnmH [Wenxinia marina]|uniref:tRNA 2-selenouridine synthase n=1 Tax=Wenxinia marina DSM 24838 TaxID=1123501 RepID=A0A0D0Q1M0_9RHOB|nr:tRNA 2-selenouridine(34) synthase MnmH [Wenxinia marina]KIQ68474.1 tRNA 2-selenouridine synthase [Wenxinia marina DSM 24838]GGL66060.1 tRNA 2-selenouridine synthase [Wenxinia marina]
MALRFDTLLDLLAHGFDTVIDVRSPAEYAEDHVPGAINLPVLDNEERARVGTIYVQQSPFLARKIGAALVFQNAARHIAGPLAHHEGGWRPLVYCWRGGQRSGSFGWMLREIGWRAEVVEGGYRSYRRLVHASLYAGRVPHRLILLDGFTGTAKTELLGLVAARGGQVIDLEGLARHRGSLLGAMPGGQPDQKAFETDLAVALSRLDPARPVLVEAESNKVGDILIPPAMWAAMKAAPRIEVAAPVESRARYLARAYDDILSDDEGLKEKLSYLRRLRGGEVVDGWFALIDEGRRVDLTRALAEQHYDPAYAKSRATIGADVLAEVAVPDLETGSLDAAAAQIRAIMERGPD